MISLKIPHVCTYIHTYIYMYLNISKDSLFSLEKIVKIFFNITGNNIISMEPTKVEHTVKCETI